jgi:hypothetical protein
MSRYAQGAYEVLDVIACFLVRKLLGGGAHDLENDLYGAVLTIRTCDGQRNSLAVFIHAKNDELTGTRLVCHEGSFDLELNHGGVQHLFVNDSVHFVLLILKWHRFKQSQTGISLFAKAIPAPMLFEHFHEHSHYSRLFARVVIPKCYNKVIFIDISTQRADFGHFLKYIETP